MNSNLSLVLNENLQDLKALSVISRCAHGVGAKQKRCPRCNGNESAGNACRKQGKTLHGQKGIEADRSYKI